MPSESSRSACGCLAFISENIEGLAAKWGNARLFRVLDKPLAHRELPSRSEALVFHQELGPCAF